MRFVQRLSALAAAAVLALNTTSSVAEQRATTPLEHTRQSAHSLGAVALPAMRGEEAIHRLRHENLYESLTATYEAARYRIEPNRPVASPATSEWRASNPAWEMSTDFASDAVRVGTSKSGGAARSITLRLVGYGYDGALQPPAPAEITATDNRVEYQRGAVTEWYVNDRKGLEQGFTVSRPPAIATGGSLVLAMAVETELEARFREETDQVQFVDSTDRVWFQYAHLKAWDAAGRDLPTEMQTRNGQIALLVDDRSAAYPLTIDPLIFTETKLTASDAAAEDFFGNSVAISGDTVVVGAPGDDLEAGSAYVFVRAGGVWSQQHKLTASDAAAADQFGISVAISGDTAVVGARADESPAAGVAGSAYVFVRAGGVWSQQQKLAASDAAANDSFGNSVAISGDTAVVGAYGDDFFVGSAYVFVRAGGVWTQQQKLTASDAAANADLFGTSVAISGDTAVVGARSDETTAGGAAGSAYVFVRAGGVWSQQQKLTASDAAANDQFGLSVAISGDTAVIGAPVDETPAGDAAGSAYVFVRAGGVWSQRQKLTASDAAANNRFGDSVAISGDTAVVGAPRARSLVAGFAYVFVRTGGVWTQQQKLTASDAAGSDLFGNSVTISGDTAVVGAPGDDAPAGDAAGSAYVYVDTTAADLLVSLGQDRLSVKQGGTLTYLITVENFGPSRAVNTVISDTLPSGTTFGGAHANKGSFRAPPLGQNGTVTWSVGELLPADLEAAQLQVTVIIRGRTTITNTVTAESDTPDPNAVNNSASITTTVAPGGGKN